MRKIAKLNADEVTFGIELETVIPNNAPVDVGPYHNGYAVDNAPKFNGNAWRAERDGSIVYQTGFRPCEFVSPVLKGPEGVAHLIEFLAWLRGIGARVNASCGCHVHVGIKSVIGAATDEEVANYVRKFAGFVNANATFLFAQTGTRRDQSHYCATLGEADRFEIDRARRAGNVDAATWRTTRYHVVNVTNVLSRGTLEVRAFAGTTSTEKVLHHLWSVLFCAKFAQEMKRTSWTGRGTAWACIRRRHPEAGVGECAVRGFHKRMRNHCLVGAMADYLKAMKKEARRLAVKFDGRGLGA